MKIAKLLSVTFVLLLVCNITWAQSTPEAIIGQCPHLPSAAYLAAGSDNEAARAAIDEFYNQIHRLRESAKGATDAAEAAGRQDAERITKQMTGKSVSQVQNMSDSEANAMANKMVGQRLAGAGLGNMSLSDLQALENKSDSEIMAAMTGGGVNYGGLTPEELKAMENMTDKQKEAYMKQGDRMQRMQAAAPSQQAQVQAQAQAKKAMSQAQVSAEMKKITDRWQEIDRLNTKETQDVAVKVTEIYARYQPQIDAVPRSDKQKDGEYHTEAEQKNVARLCNARDVECYTIWRNQVSQMQGRIKTKMADAARYDELQAQSMSSSGMTAMAKVMPSIGFSIAGQYLDVTSSVTSLPR